MSEFSIPVISPAGRGRATMAFGTHVIRISGQETGGALGVIRMGFPMQRKRFMPTMLRH